MNFAELTWKRKSIRSFKEDAIPLESINALLDAARSAPSAGNCQPWHFYVVKDAEVQSQLCEVSWRQRFIATAPLCMVVCADISRTIGRYGDRGRELYCLQDTAAAIQNMLLCAQELGLAACWIGAFDEEAVGKVLGLRDDMRPIAIIPMGYAAGDSGKTGRRSISEISTFIGFDEKEKQP